MPMSVIAYSASSRSKVPFGVEERALLEDMPGVVARYTGIDVVIVGAGALIGRGALTPGAATVFGGSIVGEDAFGIADRLADRLVGQIALGPDAADQPLRHLAGVDREIVHELRLLAELLHDL